MERGQISDEAERFAVAITATRCIPVVDLPDSDRRKQGLIDAGWNSTYMAVCRVFIVCAWCKEAAISFAMDKMKYAMPDRNWQQVMFEVIEVPEHGEYAEEEEDSKQRVKEAKSYMLTF